MAGFVLDCSVTLSWLLPDEASGFSRQWMTRLVREGGIVPHLWSLEVANALLTAQRRQRLSREQRLQALQGLTSLPIAIDPDTSAHAWRETSQLADDHGLTVYDAAYLELAVRRHLPLATFDGRLKAAAERFGLSA